METSLYIAFGFILFEGYFLIKKVEKLEKTIKKLNEEIRESE